MPGEPDEQGPDRVRVLVVEDDELVRAYVADLLSDAGMVVTITADPRRALDAPVGLQPPLVLVADVDLGADMGGFELAAAARHRWPFVRTILISGGAVDLDAHRLHPSDRFLAKPFRAADLLGAIEAAFAADDQSFPSPEM